MRGRDIRRPLTHGVAGRAVHLDVGGIDLLDGLGGVRVAERDDGLDLLGGRGGEAGHGVVGDDGALAVAGEHELRGGTLLEGLVREVRHGLFARRVAAGDVAGEVGGVVDALGGDVVGAEGLLEVGD